MNIPEEIVAVALSFLLAGIGYIIKMLHTQSRINLTCRMERTKETDNAFKILDDKIKNTDFDVSTTNIAMKELEKDIKKDIDDIKTAFCNSLDEMKQDIKDMKHHNEKYNQMRDIKYNQFIEEVKNLLNKIIQEHGTK